MREVSRSIVVGHKLIRPFVASRQARPERINELYHEGFDERNIRKMANAAGARLLRPLAIAQYDRVLSIASAITGENVIGAGLEAIAILGSNSKPVNGYPLAKYATTVMGDAAELSDEMARRLEKAHNVFGGKYIIDTLYEPAVVRGRTEPTIVAMNQPMLHVTGDGETDPRVFDQRGEFKELALKLANDEGLYVDVAPGHGNLVVHDDEGVGRLALVDSVFVSRDDKVRPFLPRFLPNIEEEMRWINMLAA